MCETNENRTTNNNKETTNAFLTIYFSIKQEEGKKQTEANTFILTKELRSQSTRQEGKQIDYKVNDSYQRSIENFGSIF